MIPGIILAAGLSTRMGKPKALLPVRAGGPSFVRHLSSTLLDGGVSDVIVIGRPADEALRVEVDAIGARVRLVLNTNADSGQLSSVLSGLNAADRPGVHAILVTPVDVPLVRAGTIQQLLAALAIRNVPLVRAVHKGRHGHPVLFARAVFDELRHADPSMGAKAVVQRHEGQSVDVEVDDPGVLHDIDEPGDYARAIDENR